MFRDGRDLEPRWLAVHTLHSSSQQLAQMRQAVKVPTVSRGTKDVAWEEVVVATEGGIMGTAGLNEPHVRVGKAAM